MFTLLPFIKHLNSSSLNKHLRAWKISIPLKLLKIKLSKLFPVSWTQQQNCKLCTQDEIGWIRLSSLLLTCLFIWVQCSFLSVPAVRLLCTVTVAWFMWRDSSINYSRKAVALGDQVKLLTVFKTTKIQATYLLSQILLINLTVFHL